MAWTNYDLDGNPLPGPTDWIDPDAISAPAAVPPPPPAAPVPGLGNPTYNPSVMLQGDVQRAYKNYVVNRPSGLSPGFYRDSPYAPGVNPNALTLYTSKNAERGGDAGLTATERMYAHHAPGTRGRAIYDRAVERAGGGGSGGMSEVQEGRLGQGQQRIDLQQAKAKEDQISTELKDRGWGTPEHPITADLRNQMAQEIAERNGGQPQHSPDAVKKATKELDQQKQQYRTARLSQLDAAIAANDNKTVTDILGVDSLSETGTGVWNVGGQRVGINQLRRMAENKVGMALKTMQPDLPQPQRTVVPPAPPQDKWRPYPGALGVEYNDRTGEMRDATPTPNLSSAMNNKYTVLRTMPDGSLSALRPDGKGGFVETLVGKKPTTYNIRYTTKNQQVRGKDGVMRDVPITIATFTDPQDPASQWSVPIVASAGDAKSDTPQIVKGKFANGQFGQFAIQNGQVVPGSTVMYNKDFRPPGWTEKDGKTQIHWGRVWVPDADNKDTGEYQEVMSSVELDAHGKPVQMTAYNTKTGVTKTVPMAPAAPVTRPGFEGAAQAPAQPSVAAPVVTPTARITTAAEYHALPPGATYVDPAGTKRAKPTATPTPTPAGATGSQGELGVTGETGPTATVDTSNSSIKEDRDARTRLKDAGFDNPTPEELKAEVARARGMGLSPESETPMRTTEEILAEIRQWSDEDYAERRATWEKKYAALVALRDANKSAPSVSTRSPTLTQANKTFSANQLEQAEKNYKALAAAFPGTDELKRAWSIFIARPTARDYGHFLTIASKAILWVDEQRDKLPPLTRDVRKSVRELRR